MGKWKVPTPTLENMNNMKAMLEQEGIDFNDDNLDEDIEKHNELNPKLFDGTELKPEVKETINKIVDAFIEEFRLSDIDFKLKDIVLIGSNVSYNYTDDSDLDVHIIADSSNLKGCKDLYSSLYDAYRHIFNKNFDITINGVPVEIFVELGNIQGRSNGVYSLNIGWIKEPELIDIPDLDEEAFDELFKEWEDKYFKLLDRASTEVRLDNDDQKLKEDLILNGLDRIIEGLHPDVKLRWMGKGNRMLMDADTFTKSKEGSIISIPITINNKTINLKYEVLDGYYLDDEAINDSHMRDIAAEYALVDDNVLNDMKWQITQQIYSAIEQEFKSPYLTIRSGIYRDGIPTNLSAEFQGKRVVRDNLIPSEEVFLESLNKLTSEEVDAFIDKLYELRKSSIAAEGEYGLGNLVFKEFRNLGYLDSLKDLSKQLKSEELSLLEKLDDEHIVSEDDFIKFKEDHPEYIFQDTDFGTLIFQGEVQIGTYLPRFKALWLDSDKKNFNESYQLSKSLKFKHYINFTSTDFTSWSVEICSDKSFAAECSYSSHNGFIIIRKESLNRKIKPLFAFDSDEERLYYNDEQDLFTYKVKEEPTETFLEDFKQERIAKYRELANITEDITITEDNLDEWALNQTSFYYYDYPRDKLRAELLN